MDRQAVINALRDRARKFVSLDTPADADLVDTAQDIGYGFVPVLGQALATRDYERARREDDKLGMLLSAAGMLPIAGGVPLAINKARKGGKAVDETVKALRNPSQTVENAANNANARAGVLNEITGAAAKEALTYEPATQRLAGMLADGHNLAEIVPYNKLIGTRAQITDVIQNDADALAKALRDRGLTVTVHHSGSAAGPSSYLNVFDESVWRFLSKPIRLSNHSKGPFGSSGVIDVQSANEFEDVISKALALRDLGKSESLLERERMQQQTQIKTTNYWQGVAARAAQKQELGQSLSNRERQALNWIEKNKDLAGMTK